MNWKQAVFLGGAVLLLAACSDATAPQSQLRQAKVGASVKAPVGGGTVTTAAGCRTGYSVNSGQADTTASCQIQF
jgi:hypothetical protein